MKDCDFTELKHDFTEALEHIDFKKYDPYSREFMKALFIGQLYMAAKCLCDDDDVEEELECAKKYMNEYLDNGDSAYKEMARDELKHAGILIKEHYKHADADMKATLEEHENERQELLKRLEKEE